MYEAEILVRLDLHNAIAMYDTQSISSIAFGDEEMISFAMEFTSLVAKIWP